MQLTLIYTVGTLLWGKQLTYLYVHDSQSSLCVLTVSEQMETNVQPSNRPLRVHLVTKYHLAGDPPGTPSTAPGGPSMSMVNPHYESRCFFCFLFFFN